MLRREFYGVLCLRMDDHAFLVQQQQLVQLRPDIGLLPVTEQLVVLTQLEQDY